MLLPADAPTPRAVAEAALTWIDFWGFGVAIAGVVASSLVAGVAVWISLSSQREARRREARSERAEWVRLFGAFLNGWVRHLSGRAQVRSRNRDWGLRYDEVLVPAQLLEPGAEKLLIEAFRATRIIEEKRISRKKKHKLAENAREKLVEWARAWVLDPSFTPGEISDFI